VYLISKKINSCHRLLQFGLVVHNSAITSVLVSCPNLRHLHANSCPDLSDADLRLAVSRMSHASQLECFYIYEAPQLTVTAFQILLEGFPNLVMRPGTDVMIFKFFRRKIQQKNWRF
jgi:hypothetical protein